MKKTILISTLISVIVSCALVAVLLNTKQIWNPKAPEPLEEQEAPNSQSNEKKKNLELNNLSQKIKGKNLELKKLDEKIESKTTEVKNFDVTIQAKKIEIGELDGKIKKKEKEIEILDEKITKPSDELFTPTLPEKSSADEEEKIKNLNRDIDTKNTELLKLKKEIKKKNDEIVSLDKQIAKKEKELESIPEPEPNFDADFVSDEKPIPEILVESKTKDKDLKEDESKRYIIQGMSIQEVQAIQGDPLKKAGKVFGHKFIRWDYPNGTYIIFKRGEVLCWRDMRLQTLRVERRTPVGFEYVKVGMDRDSVLAIQGKDPIRKKELHLGARRWEYYGKIDNGYIWFDSFGRVTHQISTIIKENDSVWTKSRYDFILSKSK